MTKKRFKLKEDCDWWGITDNTLPKTEYEYREDLSDEYLSCDYCWNDLTHQEVVDLLNNLNDENEQLKNRIDDYNIAFKSLQDLTERKINENEQLKSELKTIQDTFEVSWTQNHIEFNKDELFIKDIHTRLHLKNNNLFIQVFIPSINEYYYFKYRVTGRSLMSEFIENYNPTEDLK